ncbi:PREDICTED: protein MKS1 [Tarenaya hassleriana]|uniref:protein MKS1 n=1 Tax=Tarenaya hassleriana TaxID=28532 RepID=UPI00053C3782|nr:PREDICTED: protein MKS1 [Tarenaya hassleriana]
MEPPEKFAGDKASDQQEQKRQLQIHGPRPSPLSVSKDSHKIKKPPKPPPPHAPPRAAVFVPREPVVIYAISPKVVHTTVSDFMTVVQRLTGISSGVFQESDAGGLSPAARLAATENASPRVKEPARDAANDVAGISEAAEEAVGLGRPPGILSPSPAMLPVVPAGIFSPAVSAGMFSPAGMMSPFVMFSPSYMPGSSMVSSPTLSSDFFSQIWDL